MKVGQTVEKDKVVEVVVNVLIPNDEELGDLVYSSNY